MEPLHTPDNLVIFNRAELVSLMDKGLVTADTHLPLARVARFFYTRVLATNATATLAVEDIWSAYQNFAQTHPCATPPDFTPDNFAHQLDRLVMAYGSALLPSYQAAPSAPRDRTITAVTGTITLLPFDAPEAYVEERIGCAHAHLSQRLAARRAASSTANVVPSAVAPAVSQLVNHLARIVGQTPCAIDYGQPAPRSAPLTGASRQRIRDMGRDRDR